MQSSIRDLRDAKNFGDLVQGSFNLACEQAVQFWAFW